MGQIFYRAIYSQHYDQLGQLCIYSAHGHKYELIFWKFKGMVRVENKQQ